MLDQDGPELALIVGAARSGTTLARLLLDAHPDIGCPAEAGLPGLLANMARVWATVDADIIEHGALTDPGQPRPENQTAPDQRVGQRANLDGGTTEAAAPQSGPPMPPEARAWIRSTANIVMRRYCDRGNKRLYVDKSLDSVFYLELVRDLFPEVRCVLAFRHVMDTIASGIEASPWGFQAYGYAPYVQTSPGNTVVALARYWLDHVNLALAWEKQHPESCIRLRYEDLVSSPDETMAQVQHFLGVREDLSVLTSAFDREAPRGPGDYKVEHTRAVHAQSVGHGKRVPIDMIPPALLGPINESLTNLGYPPLDRSWNTAERTLSITGETIWTSQLRDLMSAAKPPAAGSTERVFALVSEDHQALRWIIDCEAGTLTQGDGDVDAVLTGTSEDLVLMLTSQENLGSLLRAGRIRHMVADEDEGVFPSDQVTSAKALVEILRASMANGPGIIASPIFRVRTG